jgi:hypothetical protein
MFTVDSYQIAVSSEMSSLRGLGLPGELADIWHVSGPHTDLTALIQLVTGLAPQRNRVVLLTLPAFCCLMTVYG